MSLASSLTLARALVRVAVSPPGEARLAREEADRGLPALALPQQSAARQDRVQARLVSLTLPSDHILAPRLLTLAPPGGLLAGLAGAGGRRRGERADQGRPTQGPERSSASRRCGLTGQDVDDAVVHEILLVSLASRSSATHACRGPVLPLLLLELRQRIDLQVPATGDGARICRPIFVLHKEPPCPVRVRAEKDRE